MFGHGGAWADTDFNDAFPSTTAIRTFGDDDAFAAGRIGTIETIGGTFLRKSQAVGRSPFGSGRTSDHIWEALSRVGLIRAVDADIGALSEGVS